MAHSNPPAGPDSAFEEPLILGDTNPALVGSVLGSYQIVSLIGKGGMAEVYHAQRVGDFDHSVAIKIALPSHGLRVSELADRLRFERATMASLSHPHIARLFDGGTLRDGRPYLVMEYIAGERLDKYCDRRGLKFPVRIEVFLSVCDAIAYAHDRFIAHRDLKPSNILVDAQGTAKVLDFGIARAFAESADGQHPGGYSRAFSPFYSPPEQIRQAGSITVASQAVEGDVYSLGAVLFELLTGAAPPSATVTEQSFAAQPTQTGLAARGSVTGQTGSVCLPTAKADSAWISLPYLIRVDLEGIVRKCLAYAPANRYHSVADLICDIQQAVAGRAVSATASNRTHRIRKHFRRFRVAYSVVAVLGGATATAVAAAMQTASAMQRQSEELARGLATKKSTAEVLFALRGTHDKNMPVIERLRDYLLNLPTETRPSGEHVADAESLSVRGTAAEVVELHITAEILFKRSLREWEAVAGANTPYLLEPLFGLSRVYSARHLPELAIPYHARAIAILEQHFPPMNELVTETKLDHGLMLIAAGHTAEASALADQYAMALLAIAKNKELAERSSARQRRLANRFLGLVYLKTARPTEAKAWLQYNAEEALSGAYGGTEALQSVLDYAQYLVENDNVSDAEQFINEFVSMQGRQPLASRTTEAMIRVAWADVLASTHREQEAITLYRLHLNRLRAELGVSHFQSLWYGYKYALLLQGNGQSRDAEGQLEHVIACWEGRGECLPVEWRRAIDALASVLLNSSQPENAFGLVRQKRQAVLEKKDIEEEDRTLALADLERTEQAVRGELAKRGVSVPHLPWDHGGEE